jgi:hypothetical protein
MLLLFYYPKLSIEKNIKKILLNFITIYRHKTKNMLLFYYPCIIFSVKMQFLCYINVMIYHSKICCYFLLLFIIHLQINVQKWVIYFVKNTKNHGKVIFRLFSKMRALW